jgi:hypothetical protein
VLAQRDDFDVISYPQVEKLGPLKPLNLIDARFEFQSLSPQFFDRFHPQFHHLTYDRVPVHDLTIHRKIRQCLIQHHGAPAPSLLGRETYNATELSRHARRHTDVKRGTAPDHHFKDNHKPHSLYYNIPVLNADILAMDSG